MKLNKKIILISVLTIFFVSVCGWLIWYNQSKASLNWKEGDRKMYNISIDSFQNTSSEQFGMYNSGFTGKIDATLNFRVLEYSKEKVKIAFQLSPIKIQVGEQQLTQLEKLHSQLFLGEWNPDGSVIKWIFPSTIAEKDELGVIQNILFFQLIIKGDKHKWISEERDSLGNFIAKYNSKSNKILKSKVNYTKIYTEDVGSVGIIEEGFTSNIQISYAELFPDKVGSWLTSANFKEKAEITGNGFDISISRNGTIDEMEFNPDKSLVIWTDDFNFEEVRFRLTSGTKQPLSIWEMAEKVRIEQEYKNETIESLLAKFFKDPRKYTDLADMEKMKVFLTHFPEEALKVPDLLLKEKIKGNHILEIIHLLATTGHKESQRALVSILSNKDQSAHSKMQALAGFQEVRNPSEDSAGALWKVYEYRKTDQDRDYSNTAILALGTVALHTKQSEIIGKESLPAKIKARLVSEMASSSKDPNRLAVLLDAAGNTQDSSMFPKIKEFATSEDKVARSSLYNSLGNFKDKESLEFLRTQVGKEESPEGRSKIMQSLINRSGDKEVTKTIQSSIVDESDTNTRAYMLQYLIQNKKDVTDYKSTLEKLLESEPNESNRELILIGIHSE